MSTGKRRLVKLLDRRLFRRIIVAPLVALVAVISVVLSPLIVIGLLVLDKATGQDRYRRTRLAVLVIGALLVELLGMAASLSSWVMTGFGLLGSPRWRWHLHRWYMGVYTRTMFGLITRVLGASVEWRDEPVEHGPIVLVARHTSFFDALIPATVLSNRNSLLAHHVVTQGLRYAPCIDIVGHRFPNRFIQRSPGAGSSELVHITDIGAVLDERSAAIIFPEGTFRNPERFERIVRRLRRREPELAERARGLRHVLPPRANGTYALLEGAPTADVLICANTGLEAFGSIKDIVSRPFSDQPVIVETWRIPRSDIPMTDVDTFGEWLFGIYEDIEAWVEREHMRFRAVT